MNLVLESVVVVRFPFGRLMNVPQRQECRRMPCRHPVENAAGGTQVGANVQFGHNAIGFSRNQADPQQPRQERIEDCLDCSDVSDCPWKLPLVGSSMYSEQMPEQQRIDTRGRLKHGAMADSGKFVILGERNEVAESLDMRGGMSSSLVPQIKSALRPA
jgi:hypothetical protein